MVTRYRTFKGWPRRRAAITIKVLPEIKAALQKRAVEHGLTLSSYFAGYIIPNELGIERMDNGTAT